MMLKLSVMKPTLLVTIHSLPFYFPLFSVVKFNVLSTPLISHVFQVEVVNRLNYRHCRSNSALHLV